MFSEPRTLKIRSYYTAEWFVLLNQFFSFPRIHKIMIPILPDFQHSSLDNIISMLIIWPKSIKSEKSKSYINTFH